MRITYGFLVALVLGSTVAANADSFISFNLSGALVPAAGSSSIVGTVMYDSTLGKFTDSDFTVSYGGTTQSFTGAPFTSGSVSNAMNFSDFGTSYSYFFALDLPGGSLASYGGGPLCSTSNPCIDGSTSISYSSFVSMKGVNFDTSTGSLSAVTSQVPEPSSVVLLATGLGFLAAPSILVRPLFGRK